MKDRKSLWELTSRLLAATAQYENTYGESESEDRRISLRQEFHHAGSHKEVDKMFKMAMHLESKFELLGRINDRPVTLNAEEKYQLYNDLKTILETVKNLDEKKGGLGSTFKNFLNNKGRLGLKRGGLGINELVANVLYDVNPELKEEVKKTNAKNAVGFIKNVLQKSHGSLGTTTLIEIVEHYQNKLQAEAKQKNQNKTEAEAKPEKPEKEEKEEQSPRRRLR